MKNILVNAKKRLVINYIKQGRHPVVNGIRFSFDSNTAWLIALPNNDILCFNVLTGNSHLSFQLFYLIFFDYLKNFCQIKVIFFEWKKKETKRRYFNDLIS